MYGMIDSYFTDRSLSEENDRFISSRSIADNVSQLPDPSYRINDLTRGQGFHYQFYGGKKGNPTTACK